MGPPGGVGAAVAGVLVGAAAAAAAGGLVVACAPPCALGAAASSVPAVGAVGLIAARLACAGVVVSVGFWRGGVAALAGVRLAGAGAVVPADLRRGGAIIFRDMCADSLTIVFAPCETVCYSLLLQLSHSMIQTGG